MLLTVAIPTHDGRARQLGQALNSLLPQIGPELEGVVEVCISDNGSRDGTDALVRGHVEARPGVVRAHRFAENQGFTANLLQAVGMGRGTFCWTFSSDDAVAPGGLARVLDALERHPDATGACLEPVAYDVDGDRPARPAFYRGALPTDPGREQHWTTVEDVVLQCGGVIGVLPAQIARRDRWDATVAALGDDLRRTPRFPHLAITYRMVLRDPSWLWIPGEVLRLRSGAGNSVLDELRGADTRYHLETTAESVAIWREAFGDRPLVLRSLERRCLDVIWNPVAIGTYKATPQHTLADDARLLVALPRWFGSVRRFWLTRFPFLLVPRPVALGLALVLRRLRARRAQHAGAT